MDVESLAALLPPGSVYAFLAEQFCVCDRWFCSVGGATMPNRCYAAAGTSGGTRDNLKPPQPYNLPTFVRHLKDDQFKLYKMIWDRFLASQMTPAVYDQTSIDIEAGY